MNDTIETTLLLNLFYFENGTYTRNENFKLVILIFLSHFLKEV